jgi:hypothetical protein
LQNEVDLVMICENLQRNADMALETRLDDPGCGPTAGAAEIRGPLPLLVLEVSATCLALISSMLAAYGRDAVAFEDGAKILFWAVIFCLSLRRLLNRKSDA